MGNEFTFSTLEHTGGEGENKDIPPPPQGFFIILKNG